MSISCITIAIAAVAHINCQVTRLCGPEPLTKWVVLGVVLTQFLAAIALRNTRPLSPLFIITAYALGGTLNHNLFLAIHEITHNLAFKGINANKALAVFANLPIGIPYCAMFKVNIIPLGTSHLLMQWIISSDTI